MYKIYRIERTVNSNNADEVIYTRKAEIKEVTSVKWNDNLKYSRLSFEFQTTETVKPYDWVELVDSTNNISVLRASVYKTSKTSKGGKNLTSYLCYDYGYFLEKTAPNKPNTITIQYKNDVSISDAIKQACARGNLKTKDIADIKETVISVLFL